MTNVYLVRHGFTPTNNGSHNGQEGLWQIACDKDMPLEMEYGIKQAYEVGEFLRPIIESGSTLICASPYRRALKTLKYATENMGDNYTLNIDERIREINSGDHFAKTKEEVLREYPELASIYVGDMKRIDIAPYIGGERETDVRARTFDFVSDLNTVMDSYDNIIIFAHGIVNEWIYYWLNDRKKVNFHQKNCEVLKGNGIDSGKSLFVPKAFVPVGFMIDIDKYKEMLSSENGKHMILKR